VKTRHQSKPAGMKAAYQGNVPTTHGPLAASSCCDGSDSVTKIAQAIINYQCHRLTAAGIHHGRLEDETDTD